MIGWHLQLWLFHHSVFHSFYGTPARLNTKILKFQRESETLFIGSQLCLHKHLIFMIHEIVVVCLLQTWSVWYLIHSLRKNREKFEKITSKYLLDLSFWSIQFFLICISLILEIFPNYTCKWNSPIFPLNIL